MQHFYNQSMRKMKAEAACSIDGLARGKCVPCEGGIPRLSLKESRALADELKTWALSADGKYIRREFELKDFLSAVHLIQQIAKLAEDEGHHPDLHLTRYKNLAVELYTHAIGGLSKNDFILAAKIEAITR